MWYGRAGCWDDYQRFCADARKRRAAEQRKREQKMHDLIVGIMIAGAVIVALGAIGGIAWLIWAEKTGVI